MTSSEKILAGIIEDAKQKSDEIIADANSAAEEAVKAASGEVKAECDKIISDAQRKSDIIKSTAVTSSALIKRDKTLAYRRQAIEDILTAAAERINAMPDKEYFDYISGIAEKSRLEGSGEVRLSERDLKRDTSGFEKSLEKSGLKLSKTPADINGGFILIYGDIQINGGISALIHEKREQLVDRVNNALFG